LVIVIIFLPHRSTKEKKNDDDITQTNRQTREKMTDEKNLKTTWPLMKELAMKKEKTGDNRKTEKGRQITNEEDV
jgi:hypothetical protein